ncbi:helix-turn-helix domain-containing protein [Kitasatospora aureofaciens]|uniref:helix-turn-helix domain-containing protein n=1 Tax=Kitasatospora aureofaciens TaxID=1894 RepID=UPI00210E1371|nr:helix-turn-helix transcriptional regulator [Kitasatospora aureofaciens]
MPGDAEIGNMIRAAREALNWNRPRLARELGIAEGRGPKGLGQDSVYRWETARRTPDYWMPWLVQVLKLDPSAALGGQNNKVIGGEGTDEPVERREFLGVGAAAWAAMLSPAAVAGGQRIGTADVRNIKDRVADLRRLDDYTGGAATRPLALTEVARVENLTTGSFTAANGRALLSSFAELCQFSSWTAFDAGHHQEARQLALKAVKAANQAGDRVLASSALSELSYLTASSDNPGESVQMARASLVNAPVAELPAMGVVLADRLAWACARTGDAAGVDRALGMAAQFHDQRDHAKVEEPDWVYWINREESRIMAGRCWAQLHQPQRAVPILEQVTAPYDETHAREVALYLCWLSGSYLDAGEIDQARTTASRAAALATNTASPRTDRWVTGLAERLRPHGGIPAYA